MYWKLAGTGLAIVALLLGYRHYVGLVDTIVVLEKNNAALEMKNQAQDNTIDAQADAIEAWKASLELQQARTEEMQRVASDATAETRRLNDIFARHDLTLLARARPDRVERIINSGTADALRMLECASGAEGADCPEQIELPAERPPLPNPDAIDLRPFEWKVLTPDTLPEGDEWVFFGITPREYEKVSHNQAETLRYTLEADWRFLYYRGELPTDTSPTDPDQGDD